MATLSYRQPGLVLGASGSTASPAQIRDLQRDLRRLGYLKSGVDGKFGTGTTRAVRRLQHDLLHNDGRSTRDDGPAPVSLRSFARGRVAAVTGVVDEALAACISEMVDDAAYPKLPASDNPAQANRGVLQKLRALPPTTVPMPLLLGILMQESGLKHFHEPATGDDDTFIVVGLDLNGGSDDVVTSRGFGMGQYTLFHHPPRPDEVTGFILDPAKNVQRAVGELREKFDAFVLGRTSGTRADDRLAEVGDEPLRVCKYPAGDARYLNDCKACLVAAGTVRIQAGVTPLYAGSSQTFAATANYREASYAAVPDRTRLDCDWPYAMRRYNGAGVDSYHYQARVLSHALAI